MPYIPQYNSPLDYLNRDNPIQPIVGPFFYNDPLKNNDLSPGQVKNIEDNIIKPLIVRMNGMVSAGKIPALSKQEVKDSIRAELPAILDTMNLDKNNLKKNKTDLHKHIEGRYKALQDQITVFNATQQTLLQTVTDNSKILTPDQELLVQQQVNTLKQPFIELDQRVTANSQKITNNSQTITDLDNSIEAIQKDISLNIVPKLLTMDIMGTLNKPIQDLDKKITDNSIILTPAQQAIVDQKIAALPVQAIPQAQLDLINSMVTKADMDRMNKINQGQKILDKKKLDEKLKQIKTDTLAKITSSSEIATIIRNMVTSTLPTILASNPNLDQKTQIDGIMNLIGQIQQKMTADVEASVADYFTKNPMKITEENGELIASIKSELVKGIDNTLKTEVANLLPGVLQNFPDLDINKMIEKIDLLMQNNSTTIQQIKADNDAKFQAIDQKYTGDLNERWRILNQGIDDNVGEIITRKLNSIDLKEMGGILDQISKQQQTIKTTTDQLIVQNKNLLGTEAATTAKLNEFQQNSQLITDTFTKVRDEYKQFTQEFGSIDKMKENLDQIKQMATGDLRDKLDDVVNSNVAIQTAKDELQQLTLAATQRIEEEKTSILQSNSAKEELQRLTLEATQKISEERTKLQALSQTVTDTVLQAQLDLASMKEQKIDDIKGMVDTTIEDNATLKVILAEQPRIKQTNDEIIEQLKNREKQDRIYNEELQEKLQKIKDVTNNKISEIDSMKRKLDQVTQENIKIDENYAELSTKYDTMVDMISSTKDDIGKIIKKDVKDAIEKFNTRMNEIQDSIEDPVKKDIEKQKLENYQKLLKDYKGLSEQVSEYTTGYSEIGSNVQAIKSTIANYTDILTKLDSIVDLKTKIDTIPQNTEQIATFESRLGEYEKADKFNTTIEQLKGVVQGLISNLDGLLKFNITKSDMTPEQISEYQGIVNQQLEGFKSTLDSINLTDTAEEVETF